MSKHPRMYEISNPEREEREAAERAANAAQEARTRVARDFNALTPEQLRRQQETAPRRLRKEAVQHPGTRREVGRRAIRDSQT